MSAKRTCVITSGGRRVCGRVDPSSGRGSRKPSGAAAPAPRGALPPVRSSRDWLSEPDSTVDWVALWKKAMNEGLTPIERKALINRAAEQDVIVSERMRQESKSPEGITAVTNVNGFAFLNHTRDQRRFPDLRHFVAFEKMDDVELVNSVGGADEAFRSFRARKFYRSV